MQFFNLDKIKSMANLNSLFRKLCKKYHPDNSKTGDKEIFIALKNEYDDVKKIIKNQPTKIKINISLTNAFNGCEVNYGKSAMIKIPNHFYPSEKTLVEDLKGNLYQVSVRIVPNDDEEITFMRNGDIIVTKVVDNSIFDLLLKSEITYTIFGQEEKLQLTDDIIRNFDKFIIIPNKGYPLKLNRKKRGNLRLRLKIKNIELSKEDIDIILRMKEKYQK